MNRRDFLKLVGLSGIALALPKIKLPVKEDFIEGANCVTMTISGLEKGDYVTVVDMEGKTLAEIYNETSYHTRSLKIPVEHVGEEVVTTVRRVGEKFNEV